MWIAIWGFFAAFVFLFVGWTVMVLVQQKRAWGAFAKRHKLKYENPRFMDSPVVTGKMNKRKFSLYTGVQQTDDIRGQRFVTVIEFQIGQGMPTGAAISTPDYLSFINGLVFDQSYESKLPEWKEEYVLRTRDEHNLKAYLNDERLKILCGLFKMKNAAVLFFFDELEAVLRIETSDPLRNERHLEKIIKRIADAVEKLAPRDEEKKKFKKLLAVEKDRREKREVEEAYQNEDYTEGSEEPEEPQEPEEQDVAEEPEGQKSAKKKGASKKKKSGKESV